MIAIGGQEAIKVTDKPYYCSKKFVNNASYSLVPLVPVMWANANFGEKNLQVHLIIVRE